ncbi:unnamed protein product [Brachionus calyciflorus]|uniref:Cytochrome b5 domain-containing protein 1 n=1 Tax=Brachionus calyciflorus TaxID=104777 RepID=A0A813WC19_9BILA|nr:unnamed protein product [Brachionus calyciflorus]
MPQRPKYFTPNEVSVHNTAKDIWVSFLGKVYDLTLYVDSHSGDPMLKPIIDAAGQDISHWFDPKTKDIKKFVDPKTGCLLYFTQHGRFSNVPPACPSSDWANDFGKPWWKDEKYCIEVCSEEIMKEILLRYLKYNAHAESYTWKYDCNVLDMDKTLSENGIVDDDPDFYTLRMRDDQYLQSVILYYNDDLTEA